MKNLTNTQIINREYNFFNQLMLITENCNSIIDNRVGTPNDYEFLINQLNERKNILSQCCEYLKELTERKLQKSTKQRYNFIELKEYRLTVTGK